MGEEQTEYILGADESELDRLLAQAEIHLPEAEVLLSRVEIGAGGRALDIGCGPLGVMDLLSERVGPAGEVVGLDKEPRMIELAERTLADRGLSNVTVMSGDASATGLPADSFDLAHERLVLINVPTPEDVVAEMTRVVRPGGWVALENVDWISWTCEPANSAFDELMDALTASWKAAGLDPFIGRRLPSLLRGAGLTDVGVDAHAHVWRHDDLYQTLPLQFIDIHRERIIERGYLDAERIDALKAEAEAHLANPETFVIYCLMFQAWGRKPA